MSGDSIKVTIQVVVNGETRTISTTSRLASSPAPSKRREALRRAATNAVSTVVALVDVEAAQ